MALLEKIVTARYLKLFKNIVNPANEVAVVNAQKLAAGVKKYMRTFRNGKQVWVETIGGKITNGGINNIPR